MPAHRFKELNGTLRFSQQSDDGTTVARIWVAVPQIRTDRRKVRYIIALNSSQIPTELKCRSIELSRTFQDPHVQLQRSTPCAQKIAENGI